MARGIEGGWALFGDRLILKDRGCLLVNKWWIGT